MNGRRIAVAMLALVIFPAIAGAYPEGAPWGAADPEAQENCSTCHFDDDATLESTAIRIEDLPQSPSAGETYEFVIRFEDPDAAIAGFQLLARAAGGTAGAFSSTGYATEIGESGIRSTDPSVCENGVAWRIAWTAPDSPGETIRFFLAVTGANNDGSPFGDRVHFRSFSIML